MSLLVMAALHAHLAAAPRTELLALPTDVSGFAQGVSAASFDPATSGQLDGAELQLRQLGVADRRGSGAWAAYGAVPIARLSLFAGYAWHPLPDPISESGTLGLGWSWSPRLRLGVALRRLQLPGIAATHSVWDVGLAGRPTTWLSWSLGGDALNAPAYAGAVHINRSLRGGLAVRPWYGDPRFTLAADTRLQQAAGGWHLSDSRVLVDLGLASGLHLVGAYGRRYGHNEAFAGLQVELLHVGLQASAQVDNVTAAEGIDRWGWQLTLRQRPAESLVQICHRRVEVPLAGNLMPPAGGLFSPGKAIPTVALQLARLRDDCCVDTVMLPVDDLRVGMATVDELRQAIVALRQAGKEVVVQLHDADDKTYLLAAAADRIEMDPLGFVNLKGFSVASHFFADGLAKLGVRFDAVGVGKYKSAPDALTQNRPRPEDMQVYGPIVQEAYAALLGSLKNDRHLAPHAVEHIMTVGLMGAQQAVALGLVDAIVPSADLAQIAMASVPPTRPAPDAPPARAAWGPPPAIAVVPVVGTIVAHPGANPMPTTAADAARVVALLEAALNDVDVAGIVVRIDSPGGDVFASETIWRAMKRAAGRKPLAVSMGDMAASGGYYLAAPAGAIFAEPQTLTGSIGIFLVKPDVSGLLQWVGVHREVYAEGPHADWESVTHGLGEADRGRLQARLEALYAAFVARVAEGRHLDEGRVRSLAEGRVYTGTQAQHLGLVDHLGGLADAVAWVRQRARLADDVQVAIRLPDRSVTLPEYLSHLVYATRTAPVDAVDPLAQAVRALQDKIGAIDGAPLALLPWPFVVESAHD